MDNIIKFAIVCFTTPEIFTAICAVVATVAHYVYLWIVHNKNKNKVLAFLADNISEEEITNHVKMTLSQVQKIAKNKKVK